MKASGKWDVNGVWIFSASVFELEISDRKDGD